MSTHVFQLVADNKLSRGDLNLYWPSTRCTAVAFSLIQQAKQVNASASRKNRRQIAYPPPPPPSTPLCNRAVRAKVVIGYGAVTYIYSARNGS